MLDKLVAEDVLFQATATGAEFAEIFVERNAKNSIGLVNGNVEKANSGIDFGIGLRVIKEDMVVYSYTNKKDRNSLINMAKNCAKAIKGEKSVNHI
ncbi:MAG: PmbA/TldA family metallopeptidase, partial [Lachnospirales bacterium]